MKIFIKRTLVSVFTHKETKKMYEVRTEKLTYEPDFIFETRHKLKVKIKKKLLV